tara:strand:+ start:11002 stop:12375 length:1374 start_codon:yes stop_codon:yes gene_type:complete
MIIQYLPTKSKSNRGNAERLISYIFGKSKGDDVEKNESLTKSSIHYVGSSESLSFPDPMYKLSKGKVIKSFGDELDLSHFIDEFYDLEEKNVRTQKPLEHIVISLQEGENLSKGQWQKLVKEYMFRMGFTNHHWLSVLHTDCKNQHVHIVASALNIVPPYKRLVLGNSYEKSASIRQSLEDKFNLAHDHNPYIDGSGKSISNANVKTIKQSIRNSIDRTLSKFEYLDLPKFMKELSYVGVGCYVQLRDNKPIGLSYSLGMHKFPASKLGVGYTLRNIQEKGVFYNEEEHLNDIELMNSIEKKLTATIENGFISDKCEDKSKSNYLLLIPSKNEGVQSKRGNYIGVYKLWLPLNTIGKTKQQIKSDIQQLRLLRTLLMLYFIWLNDRDKKKKFRMGKIDAGFSHMKDINIDHVSIAPFLSEKNNKIQLRKYGCLLLQHNDVLKKGKKIRLERDSMNHY